MKTNKVKTPKVNIKDLDKYESQAVQIYQQTNEKFNFSQMKLLRLFISNISIYDLSAKIVLDKKDLLKFVANGKNGHSYLNQQIKEMSKVNVDITLKDNMDPDLLFDEVVLKKGSSKVEIKFNLKFIHSLLKFKNMYMQYFISDLTKFHSKYSIMLYEYLLMREAEKKNDNGVYVVDVDFLRFLFGTSNKYVRFDTFEQKVLLAAEDDLNQSNVQITANHKKIKRGKFIEQVQFTISYNVRQHDAYQELSNRNIDEKEDKKYDIYHMGDVITLKEGNIEGRYIVTVSYADGYVLTSTNGSKIRVVSKEYVESRSTLYMPSEDRNQLYEEEKKIVEERSNGVEQQSENLSNELAKAGISTEELSRPSKEDDTVDENDYDEKLVYEHRELTTLLNSLYKVKNKKYGDSFGQSVREFGYISALTRMSDKYNRLKQLIMSNQTGSDTDESLEDTLVDLANYCLMTVMELNHAKENCTHGNNS